MVQLNKVVLIDKDDPSVGVDLTTVGAVNALNTVIRNSSGVIIDNFEQYPDGEVIESAKKGNLALGTDGSNYQIIAVNSEGKPKVYTQDIAICVCSSSALLGAGISFLSTAANSDKGLNPFEKSKITGAAYSDVDGTIYIKQTVISTDYIIKTISVIGGSVKTFVVENVTGRIVIEYLNGATAQTTFRFEVWAQPSGVGFDVEDGKGLIDIADKSTRDMGKIDIAGFDIALPSGTNTIGSVNVTGALPTGANNIGDVDVLTLPSLPAGVNTIGKIEGVPITIILNGQKAVATAGTDEALASSTTSKWVIVKAFYSNTGYIYVGASGVTSANGYVLEAGEAIGLDIDNLNKVYINSSVSGEKVSYIGGN